jgi:hypothetical protein
MERAVRTDQPDLALAVALVSIATACAPRGPLIRQGRGLFFFLVVRLVVAGGHTVLREESGSFTQQRQITSPKAVVSVAIARLLTTVSHT